MEKTNQDKIDKKVQEAMENLQVPFNPDHWTQMEQKLKQLDATEKAFDESTHQKLSSLDVPFNASHWDFMSQKLDELDSQDANFDDSLRQVLNKTDMPFSSSHWEMMNQKLDNEFSWKTKIIRFKIVEVALMILFLFTVINVLDTEGSVNSEKIPSSNIKKEDRKFNQGTEWRNKEILPQQIKEENKVINSNNPPLVFNESGSEKRVDFNNPNQYFNALNTDIKTKAINLNESKSSFVNNTIEGSDNNTQVTGFNKNNDIIKELPVLPAPLIAFNGNNSLNINDKNIDKNIDKNTDLKKGLEIIAAAEPIEVLRTKALTISELYGEPNTPKLTKRSKWWRLGVFGTANTDMVDVSYIYKGDSGKGSDWSFNKGAGISLGYKRGKLELSSGLVYNQKKYQTQLPPEVIRGGVVINTPERVILPKSVDLDMIQIPLSMSYSIMDFGRWNVYGAIGAELNAVSKINVQYYETPDASNAQKTVDLRNIAETDIPKYGEPFKIGLDKNNNNFYFTSHASLGIEYKITPGVNAYLQPNYEKHFGKIGIGSRNDNINTLSLHAGLKMKLGRGKF
jgi:hypothetical protein